MPVEFLDIRKVAREISKSEFFVRCEIERRRLAFHRFGNRLFVSREDLNAYLERIRTAAVGEGKLKKEARAATA